MKRTILRILILMGFALSLYALTLLFVYFNGTNWVSTVAFGAAVFLEAGGVLLLIRSMRDSKIKPKVA